MPTKKRKQQSPKLRFEVFKRDSFTCAYCGSEPPAVVLEIDHIDPVASGGSDDIDNLITSCFDCNRGKGHTPLSSIPPSLKESMEVRKEKEAQIKEYRKFMAAIRRRTQRDIKKIEKIYTNKYPEYKFNERFSQVTVKRFLSMLPILALGMTRLSTVATLWCLKAMILTGILILLYMVGCLHLC